MIKCIVPISGGKDSQACAKLAVERYGANAVNGLFCDTQFEHPLTYQHVDYIAALYGVKIHKVCEGSVKEKVLKYKRFPGSGARFCTDELKIQPSKYFYEKFAKENGPFEVWYGMRVAEGSERRKRYKDIIDNETYPPHEVLSKFPKKLHKLGIVFRLPILDWTDGEVYDFLGDEKNPLYTQGFSRVGCFPCLAAGDAHKEKAFFHDETGKKHFKIVRELEKVIEHDIFTSKGAKIRNNACQRHLFEGCSFCSI